MEYLLMVKSGTVGGIGIGINKFDVELELIKWN